MVCGVANLAPCGPAVLRKEINFTTCQGPQGAWLSFTYTHDSVRDWPTVALQANPADDNVITNLLAEKGFAFQKVNSESQRKRIS